MQQRIEGQRGRLLVLVAMVGVALACASGPPLKPAVGTRVLTDRPASAVGQSDGVKVVADADAWRAFPRNIGVAIPMRVRIENNGEHPLLVRYNDFALTQPDGQRLVAERPLDVKGRAWVSSGYGYPGPYAGGGGYYVGGGPALYQRGFYLAPGYGPYYPGISPWAGPWGWDAWGWSAPSWPVELPTQDMLSRAIPEGVVQPGGVIDGFIYFPKVPKDVDQVRFSYALVDAKTQAPVGNVSIDFATR